MTDHRTLSLRDLVLFHLVTVLSLTSLAALARAGTAALGLLVLAALLFFLPQGKAVAQLSARHPEDGGIYAWTRRLFGEGHGFLCGWCYWINNVLFYPGALLGTAVIATYALRRPDLQEQASFVLPFTFGTLWIAAFANCLGTARGRWLQNAGGVAVWVPFLLLLAAGLPVLWSGKAANALSPSRWLPHASGYEALNFWALVPFSFAGLELAATLGGVIREPARSLPRSVWLAAPPVLLLYLAGALSLLALLPHQQIDPIGGIFQAIGSAGFPVLAAVAAACAVLGRIGSVGAWITGSARVAFAVGVDRYLPPAFATLHPRWGTPHRAILLQTAIASVFLLAAVLGKGTTMASAFFLLVDLSLLLYFIPYLYLFAASFRIGRGWARAGAAAGFGVTLMAMGLSLVPPPGAPPVLFFSKSIGGCLLLLGSGWLLYRRARPSQPHPMAAAKSV